MKIAVVYHSESGNTAKMAVEVVKGLTSVEGIEAKAFSLDEADKAYIKESRAIILGTPVYAGTFSGKMKMWLETQTRDLELGGKLGGAFATARFVHGGGCVAIQSILSHLLVLGLMVYSSGAAKGQPVIHYGPVALGDDLPAYAEVFQIYGRRLAEQAKAIF